MSAPDLLRTIVAATSRITEVRREREPLPALERRAAAARPRGAQFEAALGRHGTDGPGPPEGGLHVEADFRQPPTHVEAGFSRPSDVEAGFSGSRDVEAGFSRPAVNIIAECKRRSPSRGVLARDYDPVAIATQYERGGAAAISVLTEPAFFDGAPEHLTAVRAAVAIPLLRKDFIVDEYQLFEARAMGADAVLLIVAALDQPELVRLQNRARALDLGVLVEVHDDEELMRAVDSGARVIGVNNRNLRTLAVDVEASYRLAAKMPAHVVAVSESGLQSRSDLEKLSAAGYRAFLIGERFMTDANPARAIGELIGIPAGRL